MRHHTRPPRRRNSAPPDPLLLPPAAPLDVTPAADLEPDPPYRSYAELSPAERDEFELRLAAGRFRALDKLRSIDPDWLVRVITEGVAQRKPLEQITDELVEDMARVGAVLLSGADGVMEVAAVTSWQRADVREALAQRDAG